jgi:BirA family biotin operon repressor/biotin-[acetyl-CoA-carboxylase] ligase
MNILWLDTIDSTNSEALRRLPELPSGTVLAAREQTAGRGQRGNAWFSQPGKNLTFSIVRKFGSGELPASQAHRLNELLSVVVLRFLEECGVEACVKWPNDIYVNRRKICGMLLENSLDAGGVSASVMGVGLNVNQTAFPQLANAVSLALCTGKEYPLEAALERIVSILESSWPLLGTAELCAAYSARLFQKGMPARYRDLLTDQEFTGVIEGVAPDGRLCIQEGSTQHFYRFKEVSYIL